MKKSKALKILEKTAVKEGVSVAEVRRGIQEALDIAYDNRKPTDVFWHKWSVKPSVEDFVIAVHGKAAEKLGEGLM